MAGNKTLKTLHCSFCGKSQHDVRMLIGGIDVFICDECIGHCNAVIAEKEWKTMVKADLYGEPPA